MCKSKLFDKVFTLYKIIRYCQITFQKDFANLYIQQQLQPTLYSSTSCLALPGSASGNSLTAHHSTN